MVISNLCIAISDIGHPCVLGEYLADGHLEPHPGVLNLPLRSWDQVSLAVMRSRCSTAWTAVHTQDGFWLSIEEFEEELWHEVIISNVRREHAAMGPPASGSSRYTGRSSLQGYSVTCAERTLGLGDIALLNPEANGVTHAEHECRQYGKPIPRELPTMTDHH